jgi:hypothetical protein
MGASFNHFTEIIYGAHFLEHGLEIIYGAHFLETW